MFLKCYPGRLLLRNTKWSPFFLWRAGEGNLSEEKITIWHNTWLRIWSKFQTLNIRLLNIVLFYDIDLSTQHFHKDCFIQLQRISEWYLWIYSTTGDLSGHLVFLWLLCFHYQQVKMKPNRPFGITTFLTALLHASQIRSFQDSCITFLVVLWVRNTKIT